MWTIAAATLCVVLTVSSSRKFLDSMALRETLTQLTRRNQLAKTAAAVLPSFELALAALVVLAPGYLPVRIAVAGLGAVFAAAGVVALARREVISCSCFGRSVHALGWRQVAALPLWTGAALALGLGPAWDRSARVLLLTALWTALVVAILAGVKAAKTEAAETRVAIGGYLT